MDRGSARSEQQASADLDSAEKYTRLVDRILSNEEGAQQALYDLFGRGLRFFFAHRLYTQDVDDKVHDTFLAVITAIRNKQVREPARLQGYVRTIAQRQLSAYIAESVKRRGERVEFSTELPVTHEGKDPEQETIARQQRQFAERILKTLPEIDQQILVRFYFMEQTVDEICQHLKLSQTQFRLRKNRAKDRFFELTRKAMRRRKLFDQIFLRKPAAAGH